MAAWTSVLFNISSRWAWRSRPSVCSVFVSTRERKCSYDSPVHLSHPRSRCLHHTPRSVGYICRCRSGSPAESRWGALQTNEDRRQVCQQEQANKQANCEAESRQDTGVSIFISLLHMNFQHSVKLYSNVNHVFLKMKMFVLLSTSEVTAVSTIKALSS